VNNNFLRVAKILVVAMVCVGLAPAFSGSRVAAQGKGDVKGIIKDEKGKPIPDATVILQMAGGAEVTLTTDKDGKFEKAALTPGTYTITYKVPNTPTLERQAHVADGKVTNADLIMSDPEILAYLKNKKEEADNEAKFGKLKAHVDAGIAALNQEQAIRAQISKATPEERPALQDKLDPLANTAIDEFKQALATLQPTEVNNLATVLNDLGTACDVAGRYDEAAQYYQQSVTVKPDAGTYNNLGIDLAKAGKFDDAKTAYEKSASLDPGGAARAYRNFGAVAYNAGKLQNPAAIEMLKKATDLDPTNAQGWFLYGAALVANMQVKQEGEKMTFILLPGTVEAYQKCIELDPNGPFGAQAKAGLEELKAMGVGVDTKITTPKVKH
jgi:tetratricopeptide (TPR) repeat protein